MITTTMTHKVIQIQCSNKRDQAKAGNVQVVIKMGQEPSGTLMLLLKIKKEPHKQMDTGHPDTKRNTETNHSEESATDHKTSHTPKIESEDVVNTKFVNDLIDLGEDYSSEIPQNSLNIEDADLIDLISLLPEPDYRESLETSENAHSNTPENSSIFLGLTR